MRRTLLILICSASYAIISAAPSFAQTADESRRNTANTSLVKDATPRSRLLERRIYTVYPAKYREQVDLAMKFDSVATHVTGRDLRVLLPNHYGPKSVFVLEVEFEDEAAQKAFWDAFYKPAGENGWIRQWFNNVQHWERELWEVY